MLFLCLYFYSQHQSGEKKKGKKGPVIAVNPKDGDQMDLSHSRDAVIVSSASWRD